MASWTHFYSYPANGLPTFDIDGAQTTLAEMFQPVSVSKDLGTRAPVYDNDRQVRPSVQTEEYVKSLKFEKVRIVFWVPGSSFLLDLAEIQAYTERVRVISEIDSVYDDLESILDL